LLRASSSASSSAFSSASSAASSYASLVSRGLYPLIVYSPAGTCTCESCLVDFRGRFHVLEAKNVICGALDDPLSTNDKSVAALWAQEDAVVILSQFKHLAVVATEACFPNVSPRSSMPLQSRGNMALDTDC
jgi:hypothetical protein